MTSCLFNFFSSRILIFLLAVIYLSSCDYSYFDPENMPDYTYGPVIVFPLVNSSLTIGNIIEEDDEIYYGDDNMIYLVYKNQLQSDFASHIINMPDQNIQKSFVLNADLRSSGNDFSDYLPFDVSGDERLDSIVLKSGVLTFQIHAPEIYADGYGLEVKVLFPGLRDEGGNQLSVLVSLGQPVNKDLQGYTLVFYTDEQHGPNQIKVEYELTLTGDGTPGNDAYHVYISHTFSDMEFRKVFGYLGQKTFHLGGGEIPVNFFSNIAGGSVEFANPTLSVKLNNSFGIPIDLQFNHFYAQGKGTYSREITGFPNPLRLNNPTLDQVGESVSTEVTLTTTNSNLSQVMEISPRTIFYDLSTLMNPDNQQNNFVLDQSQLFMDLEMELPLYGSLAGVLLEDTVDLVIKDAIQDIEWIELNIDVMNGFPIEAMVQVHFMDENNVLLMTLFDTGFAGIVDSGTIDQNGNVTSAMHKNTKVTLNRNQIDLLFRTSHLVVSSRLNTSGNGEQHVRIYSDYTFNISIGARVKVKKIVS